MTRKWMARLMVLMVSLICCGVLFFAWFVYRVIQEPFVRTDLRYEGEWPLGEDAELGYGAIIGGASFMEKVKLGAKYDIFTDHLGARVNGEGERTPEQVAILTVGGSVSYGYCLNNQDTFTQYLGRDFQVPVANFSQVGYGTLQSLQMMERHLNLKPRVVIYGFIEDHLRRNLSPCAPSGAPYCLPSPSLNFETDPISIRLPGKRQFSAEMNWKYYREILTREKVGLNDVFWRMRVDLQRVKDRAQLYPEMPPEQIAQGMVWLLKRMADRAEQAGVALVVMHIPYLNRDTLNPPPDELLAALDDRILFLDLTPLIKAHPERESLYIPNDGHPTAAGHALMARALADLLREQELF